MYQSRNTQPVRYKYDYQNNQIYVNVSGQAIFQDDYREHIVIATEDRIVIITDGKETVA